MARYRVSLTQSGKHNFAYPERANFDSSDKHGRDFFGLTSQQLHAIYTGCQTHHKRRHYREEY